MPGSFSALRLLAVYLSLVVVPQSLWMLSNGWCESFSPGSSSTQCEDCSFLPAGFTQTVQRDDRERKNTIDGYSNLTDAYKYFCLNRNTCPPQEEVDEEQRGGGNGERGEGGKDEVDVGRRRREEIVQWLAEVEMSKPDGGWSVPHSLPDLSGPCTIQRRNFSLSLKQFLQEFSSEPVILTGVSDQAVFRARSTKWNLLQEYGQDLITVATANTHSYHKIQVTVCDYVERFMRPQRMDALGNETFYHFGDNDRVRWDKLFSLYHLPPYLPPGMEPVLSFGLAGPGSGVPFHIHGPTFAETIFGRKRWFLYPPDVTPEFHPDITTLHWFLHTLPSLTHTQPPLQCTLKPEEVLFIPDQWWHATLNVDACVFMSTFLA